MSERTLYTYFRSTAAYRVRIALNLKGLSYTPHFVHLVKDGGEQHRAQYHALNPLELIPTLIDNNVTLTQSLAIIEYLEECYPATPLLPDSHIQRAKIRAVAQLICCDIHPLNNLRVLNYLRSELQQDEAAHHSWYQHWVTSGLSAVEQLLLQESDHHSLFCFGDTPTIADLCLIPQLYNARRFSCDIHHYPTLLKIEMHCMTLAPFFNAAPENQPDYE